MSAASRRFGATLMMLGTLIMAVSLIFAGVVYAQPHLLGLSTVAGGIQLTLDKSSYAYGDVIHWQASGIPPPTSTPYWSVMITNAEGYTGRGYYAQQSISDCPKAFQSSMSGSIQLTTPYGPSSLPKTLALQLNQQLDTGPVPVVKVLFEYTTRPTPVLYTPYLAMPASNPPYVTTGTLSKDKGYVAPFKIGMTGARGYTIGGAVVITQIGPTSDKIVQYNVVAQQCDASGCWSVGQISTVDALKIPTDGTYVIQATDVTTGLKSNVIVIIFNTSTFDPSTVIPPMPSTYPQPITSVASEFSCPLGPTSKPALDGLPTNTIRSTPILLTGHDFIQNGQITIIVAGGSQYNTQADSNGHISYSISTTGLALGWHDIAACNAPLVGSGSSFTCPNGQSNTVGTKLTVTVNLQATTDATYYGIFDPIRWSVTGASPGMLVVPCMTIDGTNLICASQDSAPYASQFGVYADANGAASGQVEATFFPGMSAGLQNFQIKDTFSGSLSNKIPLTISMAYTMTFTVTSTATNTAISTYVTTITSDGSTYVSTITTTNYATSAYTQTVTNFATGSTTRTNTNYATTTNVIAHTSSFTLVTTTTVSSPLFPWLPTISTQGIALVGAIISFLTGLGTTGVGVSMSMKRR